MRGIIFKINKNRGMVAVQTDTEGISVFEMSGDDNFEISDEVSWNSEESLGSCSVYNLTKREFSEIIFQGHSVPQQLLAGYLLY